MTRRLLAGLLVLAALGFAAPGRSEDVVPPSMPPERFDADEAASVREHQITSTITVGEAVIGFVLHPDEGHYGGAYLLDPESGAYEEVGAWRGTLVGPCAEAAACAEGVATLIRLLVGAAPPPASTVGEDAVPTPVEQVSTGPQLDAATAATAPLVTPTSVPPSAPPPTALPPLPPRSSVEGLPDLAIGSMIAFVTLLLLWLLLRSPRVPPGERVTITHAEHERAAATLRQRLLADKAKLEQLNREVEVEESKFIAKVAGITRKL
ncbi:MAG: hypothetical protein DIJKHBIC_02290 [Thermoanaerobaculia bacterium]|nr:hypothetical protein [Thermoanaerobaculia bacterium]